VRGEPLPEGRIVDLTERSAGQQHEAEHRGQNRAFPKRAQQLLGRDRERVGTRGAREVERRGDATRGVLRIRVGKEQPLTARVLHALIERPRLPDPTLGQRLAPHDTQARILCGQARQDFGRGIAGTIVDRDDLEIEPLLREQRSKAGFDRTLFVARGHENRDEWLRPRIAPEQRQLDPAGGERGHAAHVEQCTDGAEIRQGD
jgi:hypothetical protein